MRQPPHSDHSAPPCPLRPHTCPRYTCFFSPLPLLPARNRHSETEPLYRQALELQQRVLGPEHPSTITTFSNLAACIYTVGRWAGSDAAECVWVEDCLHHPCEWCVRAS